ncbi:TetR/AcrR family transcriptional regulator [Halobacillus litoralis]|uniref:TetR/AcrR family transcriptional regulator n=1 Tax=Halobacillus litoralis TaxID=45668 RepID=UPI001CD74690|nr:TetR/AcrR family transcriptional regulator [Halobacillus litoralis]MCA0970966.1 TetR/AcrR family transcriptional regulator [Halobacillus litoralis]
MNEKKRRLIENGMKLFAKNGFHKTSIQQIADQSGVSKGGFYLHFDSKEDLIMQIHQYYYYGLMDQVNEVKKQNLAPEDMLATQLEVLLSGLVSNKEFIIMHMQENVKMHDTNSQFFLEIKQHSFRWARSSLMSIYGDALHSKSIDAAILLEGFIQSYMKWLIIDDLDLDLHKLSKFIVRRTMDAVAGMMEEEHAPQITEEMIVTHFPVEYKKNQSKMVQEMLMRMRDKLGDLDLSDEKNQELMEAIGFMEEEILEEQPKLVLFKGMLTPFADQPEFQHEVEMIRHEMRIDVREKKE